MNKICFVLSVLFCFVLSVKAADFVVDGLVYSTNSDDTTVTVTGNQFTTFLPVVIPPTVTNPYTNISYSVTAIGESAFLSSYNIVELIIPASVSTIESKAFMDCSYLINVSIPESVESIGADAFSNTSWYRSLPEGMVYINRVLYSFKGVIPQDSAINIKPMVVSISPAAFYSQEGMSSISIPASVREIGDNAFYNCINLDTVSLPEGLEEMGYGLFSGCDSLVKVVLPDRLRTIGYESFRDCYMLSDFNLPTSLESISAFAFSGCSSFNIVDLSICPNLTFIGEQAFSYCDSLETVVIPDNVLYIRSSAFMNCDFLSHVTLSQSLTEISSSLFENCNSLTDVIIPSGVVSIGARAFQGCEMLSQIIIPDGVYMISDYAFGDCLSLSSVSFGQDSKLRYLTPNAFLGSLWYQNQDDGFLYLSDVLFGYKGEMPLNTALVVREGTTSITPGAFLGKANLLSVIIPGTVDTIGMGAFYNCARLEKATMMDGVVSIGVNAFSNCVRLDSVSLPNTLIDIGDFSFYRCLALPRISLPGSLMNIGMNAFNSCSSLKEVFIPENVVNIGKTTFSGCHSLERLVVDITNSYYSGIEGVLFDKQIRQLIKYPPASSGISYELPSEVKTIGDYAFDHSLNLTSVTLPSGLEEIGHFSFSSCGNLNQISSLNHTPPSCSATSFINVDISACSLYISGYSFNQYQAHEVWGGFIHISTNIDPVLGNKEILSRSYFGLNGMKIEIPSRDIVIEKIKFSDGTERTRKVFY